MIECGVSRGHIALVNAHVVTRSFDVSLSDIVNRLAVSFLIMSFLCRTLRSEVHVKLFRLPGCDAVQQGDQQAEERA